MKSIAFVEIAIFLVEFLVVQMMMISNLNISYVASLSTSKQTYGKRRQLLFSRLKILNFEIMSFSFFNLKRL